MIAILRSLLAVLGFAALTALVPAEEEYPSEPPENTLARHLPAGVTVRESLPYVAQAGPRQLLDLYFPPAEAAPAAGRPVVMFVHGGGWVCGSKADVPQFLGTLLTHGYVLASISYRLSQDARYPAQIEDCKAAVRWLRAHAAEYGLDRGRIGVIGPSAGGHLVALLGTTGATRDFDTGDWLAESSVVQAVADFYGPTDLSQIQAQMRPEATVRHDAPDSPEARLIGGLMTDPANAAAVQRANPIHFLTPAAPPFLLVHGDADPTVPHGQSELLYAALVEARVPVRFVTVHDGGHGERFPVSTLAPLVLDFFDQALRGRPNDPHEPPAQRLTVAAEPAPTN